MPRSCCLPRSLEHNQATIRIAFFFVLSWWTGRQGIGQAGPSPARRSAGLPDALVLYCASHTFGTAAYEATGNLAMIMQVMATAPSAPHFASASGARLAAGSHRSAQSTSQFTSQ